MRRRTSFPVTDDAIDAPDGAVVEGYKRIGDRWVEVAVERRPTRRDLLIVIGALQDAIGRAHAEHGNDRSPAGFERGQTLLAEAMELCIRARAHDAPISGRPGPWGAIATRALAELDREPGR